MKNERKDLRRIKLRYRYNKETGQTTLVIDVESPEDDMPHEHRRDLRDMAGELLGVPVDSLPEDIEVNLRRIQDTPHTHPEDEEEREELPASKKPTAIKN